MHIYGNAPPVVASWQFLVLKHLQYWLLQIKTFNCLQQGKLKFHSVKTDMHCLSSNLCGKHMKAGGVYNRWFQMIL